MNSEPTFSIIKTSEVSSRKALRSLKKFLDAHAPDHRQLDALAKLAEVPEDVAEKLRVLTDAMEADMVEIATASGDKAKGGDKASGASAPASVAKDMTEKDTMSEKKASKKEKSARKHSEIEESSATAAVASGAADDNKEGGTGEEPKKKKKKKSSHHE